MYGTRGPQRSLRSPHTEIPPAAAVHAFGTFLEHRLSLLFVIPTPLSLRSAAGAAPSSRGPVTVRASRAGRDGPHFVSFAAHVWGPNCRPQMPTANETSRWPPTLVPLVSLSPPRLPLLSSSSGRCRPGRCRCKGSCFQEGVCAMTFLKPHPRSLSGSKSNLRL